MRRERRLRAGDDFRRVRSRGKSLAHPLFVLLLADHPDGPQATTRIGFVAGKKVGNAVVRNRARRRAREIMRRHYEKLPRGLDIVLLLRSAAAKASSKELESAITTLLHRAGIRLNSEMACALSPYG